MSLVNEALKRAEEEEIRRTNPSKEPADIPSGWEQRSMKSSPRGPKVLIVLLVFLAAGAGGWFAISKMTGGATPRPAVAKVPGDSKRSPAHAIPTQQNVKVSPETELVLAQTLDELKYYTPPKRPAHPVATKAPTGQTGASDGNAKKPTTRPATQSPAIRPAKPVPPDAAVSKPQAQPADSDRPKQKVAISQIDRTRFKLSGIIQDASGGTAIVNNYCVTVGDTIDGAKVVRILESSVELEIAGQRFRVGM